MTQLRTTQNMNKYLHSLIPRICECADLYQSNLAGKNFMLIYSSKASSFQHVELNFKREHFLHLTGVKTIKHSNGGLSAAEFYNRCISRKLHTGDFAVPNTTICNQKLEVLPYLIQLPKSCKMIGEYNYSGYALDTEMIVGNVKGALGFITIPSQRKIDFYIPNTVLKEDSRDLIVPQCQRQVAAILRKETTAGKYKDLCYVAKGINTDALADYLKKQDRCHQGVLQKLKPPKETIYDVGR